MKKCTCSCGCQETVTGFELLAGEPYFCEGCTHGDCGITGFEDENDLIKHEGGE